MISLEDKKDSKLVLQTYGPAAYTAGITAGLLAQDTEQTVFHRSTSSPIGGFCDIEISVLQCPAATSNFPK